MIVDELSDIIIQIDIFEIITTRCLTEAMWVAFFYRGCFGIKKSDGLPIFINRIHVIVTHDHINIVL